jgi:hypothetical protein
VNQGPPWHHVNNFLFPGNAKKKMWMRPITYVKGSRDQEKLARWRPTSLAMPVHREENTDLV